MSATATLNPGALVEGERREAAPRRGTLEHRLERAHEHLGVAGLADCPVCDGTMERSGAAGRCRDCGARLA